jgi:hypothetical protein
VTVRAQDRQTGDLAIEAARDRACPRLGRKQTIVVQLKRLAHDARMMLQCGPLHHVNANGGVAAW